MTMEQRLAGLSASSTGRNLLLGVFVAPMGTAARTDTTGVGDGEMHAYVSGSNIILQMFSLELGAWKSVTLS